MLKYKYLFLSNVSNSQADNLHGGHNDVPGQRQVGRHQRGNQNAQQVPGNHAHDTSVNLWTDPFSAFLIGIILRFGRNGVNLAI